MENANKIIKTSISALIFCAGLFALIYEAKTYTLSLNLTRKKIKEDVIYQQYTTAERETITYAELIATLLQPLEYDIMIDKEVISKEQHSIYMIAGYTISVNEYAKSYRYDTDGNITMIVYTSKN